MPLPLSSVAIEEKNKLATDSVFLILLEITIPGTSDVVRVVHNTEDVLWNGYLWTRTQFDLATITTGSAGEVSSVELKVDNTTRVLEYYIHAYEAWCKINYRESIGCTIYVVNSLNLQRAITVNGTLEAGVTTPLGWTSSGLEESLADAWVGAGVDGSMCLRHVRSIGNETTAMEVKALDTIYFTPPYPYWFTISYWAKGETIVETGGTMASMMTASITWEDDSSTDEADPDGAVPEGNTAWYLREYTKIGVQGIKSIRPSFYSRYCSGTLYVDSLVTTMGWAEDPEAEYDFELIKPKSNPQFITFTLGASNPFNRRFPLTRLIPVCPWKFKGTRCGYAGGETACNKTFDRCKALNNTDRFRGFFTLGRPT